MYRLICRVLAGSSKSWKLGCLLSELGITKSLFLIVSSACRTFSIGVVKNWRWRSSSSSLSVDLYPAYHTICVKDAL
ncbi:hypothetical protein K2173_022343 [Erythroxylum novogranatense]|uniref:Uncharacterized protein n=1 Tax=Erythroxylum novogranatense TaxID=1862640 RepID=A0AAV8TJE3_9ROSI|nr:hypothetical protein K2173_022343 [Erythroxylum novogranatense]